MNFNLNEITKYDPKFLESIYLDKLDICNTPIEELYDNYFSDHVIETTNTKHHDLCLQRNNSIFYYVENNLNYFEKIKQLFPKFYKSQLPFYFSWDQRSLLCLNDSWSCLGWINNILNNNTLNCDEEITLIHFDSHSDMGNPLLGRNVETNKYYDLLSGNEINTSNLFDFFIATSIGSIGISNYISILPLFFKRVNVFYINQFKGADRQSRFKLDFVEDRLFKSKYPDLRRMFNIYNTQTDDVGMYPHLCVESDTIGILDLVKNNKNIYLHFDMDYFNNRLDGSAACYRNKNENPDSAKQYADIDNVVKCLIPFRNNIIHTSIGLSPGFFPSEYWVCSTTHLINALNSQGIHFALEEVFPNVDTI